MNELIKIREENGQQLVSARELHKGLELKKRFSVWIEQYIKENNKYGFEKDLDFTSVLTSTVVNNGANRDLEDYALILDMAKHIAMLTGTDVGRKFRQYFIEKEKELRKFRTKVPQLSERDNAILSVMNAKGDLEKVTALKSFEDVITKPLIAEIGHKEDVIVGLVDNIDLATKRQRITQIIRHGGRGKYRERYNLLYQEFEKKYHMDLNRRIKSCEIKPKVKNKMDYIDRVLNKIPELYEIVCKLFENDVKELVKEWEVITS